MLVHWQSHQEYLNFLHETKVHLDSSQRTRFCLEFGPVRDKLRLLDLDPVMDYLSVFYSPAGRPAKNQVQIIRSFILMIMIGFTSLTTWIRKLRADSLAAALIGCTSDSLPPRHNPSFPGGRAYSGRWCYSFRRWHLCPFPRLPLWA